MTGKGLSITAAARSLKVNRMVFYGVLLAYGIVPRQTTGGPGGRPPKVITRAQLADIRRRLERAKA